MLFRSGDQSGVADCAENLGNVAYQQHNYDEARKLLSYAIEQYCALGYVRERAACIKILGHVESVCEDYEKARAYYMEAIDLYEEMGDSDGSERCQREVDELPQPFEQNS